MRKKELDLGGMLWVGILVIAVAAAAGASAAQPGGSTAHVLTAPADLVWSEGPFPGTQAAVLEGDPKQPGPFTMRLKLPANMKLPAHWHPADEHVTVISGTFFIGTGESFDAAKAKALPDGSFALLPANMRHFAYTTDAAMIQLHGVGPWGIRFVNPAEDPRKK